MIFLKKLGRFKLINTLEFWFDEHLFYFTRFLRNKIRPLAVSQLAFTCSKSTTETPEQSVSSKLTTKVPSGVFYF